MGGRGASSGMSVKGKLYGTEYRSLLTVGNIKFIKKNDGNVTAPLETMTKGRVYVTLNNDNKPKFISYYDASNKRSMLLLIEQYAFAHRTVCFSVSCLWCFCASVPSQIPLFSGIIERERAICRLIEQ